MKRFSLLTFSIVALLAVTFSAHAESFGVPPPPSGSELSLCVDWYEGVTGHADDGLGSAVHRAPAQTLALNQGASNMLGLAGLAALYGVAHSLTGDTSMAVLATGAAGAGGLEVKELVEGIKSEWEQFKTAQTDALARLEKGNLGEGEFKELTEKMNLRLDEVETKMQRAVAPSPDGKGRILTPEMKEYSEAYNRYLRKGHEDGLEELQTKALSVGSDPDGGYTVTPYMADTMVKKLFETSPMRQYANVITLDNGVPYEELVDNDEVSTGWVGETETRSETDTPVLAKLRIEQHEQYAKPKVTQRLLDSSSFNIEDWLAGKVADKLARTETTAFYTGDGTAKPRGILTYTAGTAWGEIQQVITGVAAGVSFSGLMNLVAAIKTGYLTNAQFQMSRASIWAHRQLRADAAAADDGAGQFLWQPSLEAGISGTLLGYPVVEASDMPAIGANALPVAFGNFREAYQIVDGNATRTLRDPYSAKPYVEFYTTKYVGGGVKNFEAIALQKCST